MPTIYSKDGQVLATNGSLRECCCQTTCESEYFCLGPLDCCLDGYCVETDGTCPTPRVLSVEWNDIYILDLAYGLHDYWSDAYGDGSPESRCFSASSSHELEDNATRYWLVTSREPAEVQGPASQSYQYEIPGVNPPSGKVCRYIWRVWVGYGPRGDDFPPAPPYGLPNRCEGKMYYLYLDASLCGPSGGTLNVVEDPNYFWGPSWPQVCDPPCNTDYNGWLADLPAMTITFAP